MGEKRQEKTEGRKMNIKGNLGDRVNVPGTIRSISINESGVVRYGVKLDFDNSSAYILEESEFEFPEKENSFETPGDIPKRKRRVSK